MPILSSRSGLLLALVFLLAEASSGTTGSAWDGSSSAPSNQETRPAVQPPATTADPLERAAEEAEIRYRRAIALFAKQDQDGALALLHQLASDFAASSTFDGLAELRRVELEVARSFPPSQEELLIPLVALHELALLERLERKASNAPHERDMMLALSELYAARAESPEAQRIASDLLASLAGYLRQTSTALSGMDYYQRALRFDWRNEAALMGLATAHEQQGRYDRTIPLLQRLADSYPDYPEGRLRLAINLSRTSQQPRALSILQTLESNPAPDWVQSLGLHEQARILVRMGRLDEAAATLERGLERFPEDSAMRILLTYVDERRGQDQPSTVLRSELEASTDNTEPSPRFLYSRDPTEPLARARQRLRDRAELELAALARSFAGWQVEPGG